MDFALTGVYVHLEIPAGLLEQSSVGWERVIPPRLHAQQGLHGGGGWREVGSDSSIAVINEHTLT